MTQRRGELREGFVYRMLKLVVARKSVCAAPGEP